MQENTRYLALCIQYRTSMHRCTKTERICRIEFRKARSTQNKTNLIYRRCTWKLTMHVHCFRRVHRSDQAYARLYRRCKAQIESRKSLTNVRLCKEQWMFLKKKKTFLIHAYFLNKRGKMVETLFAKASRFDVFFLVFRQKSRNDHGIESRIRERKREGGGESSHR